MPVSGLHRQIAALALAAAGEHGFAPGGGNALLAQGVISRPTQDAGLFTGQEHGARAAAGFVEAALRAAGFGPGRQDQAAGLTGIFPGMGEGLAEWIVTAPAGSRWRCSWLIPARGREPVIMDIGPVLDLEDVVGGKVCALASRIEPRDYAESVPVVPLQATGKASCWSRSAPPPSRPGTRSATSPPPGSPRRSTAAWPTTPPAGSSPPAPERADPQLKGERRH